MFQIPGEDEMLTRCGSLRDPLGQAEVGNHAYNHGIFRELTRLQAPGSAGISGQIGQPGPTGPQVSLEFTRAS